MLVLSRKKQETIAIGDSSNPQAAIRVVVLEIGNGFVKLGIEAPMSVPVHRLEVWERLQVGPLPAKAS